MTYALESKKEFERLERQSHLPAYDFRKELADFRPLTGGKILDAGCGSGIVTRHLAEICPQSMVFGCDASSDRIEQARKASTHLHSVEFKKQDLTKLSYPSNYFDRIVCRFVIEHLKPADQTKVLKELNRCLKPNGSIYLIDVDGLIFNVYPQSTVLAKALTALQKALPIDMFVGRKLPSLLKKAGLDDVTYRVEAMQFHGEDLTREIHMMEERFDQATPLLKKVLKAKATQFKKEYLKTLKEKGTTLFYNKFVVIGTKRTTHLRVVKG